MINKYWKPPNSTLRKQLGGRDPNNKFDGFKVINYHSFVNPSDITGKSPPEPALMDVKFTFNTDYQPRKLGRPNILTYNASGFDFKANIFGKVDKKQDIFVLAYGPNCTAPIIELIISDSKFECPPKGFSTNIFLSPLLIQFLTNCS